jgi:hypothetical protein
LTWPFGLLVDVEAGVPALLCAPLPIWVAGVVELAGGFWVWLELWAAANKTWENPIPSKKSHFFIKLSSPGEPSTSLPQKIMFPDTYKLFLSMQI